MSGKKDRNSLLNNIKGKCPTVLRQDTIAAIATPFGMAGVGIIRISGPEALEIARRIFQPAQANCPWETHHLYHGDIVSADGNTHPR